MAKTLTNLFAGTFLAEVMVLVESGRFEEPPEPIEDGEKVIGEMTTFEKAIFTLRRQRGEKIKKELDACRNCTGKEHDECHVTKNVQVMKRGFDDVSNLMWNLVQERLQEYGGTIALRKGYKIVKCPSEEPREMPDLLKMLLMAGLRSA